MFKNFIEEIKRVGRGFKKLRFFQFADMKNFFSVMGRREKIIFVLLVLVFAIDLGFVLRRSYVSHTTEIPAQSGTLHEGMIGTPQFINPLLALSQTDLDLSRLVYSGLYKRDAQGGLIPDLADGNAQISKNQLELTVKLKPGLKWQDNSPLNADDVVYTISTLQNTDYKSPYSKAWQNVSVQKIDDLTVKFVTKDISAPFLSNLTFGILPKHVWANIDPAGFVISKYNMEPIGSGPYAVEEISKSANDQIISYTLQANENYWAGRPKISNIILMFYSNYQDALSALHGKDIDALGFIPFDAKIYVDSNTKLKIEKLPVNEYQALFFNQSKLPKILGDINVRAALASGVDRSALINDVYNGLAQPAYSPIMPGQLGADPDASSQHPYDLDIANSLLAKDGWSMDPNTGFRTKGGQQLGFTITTNDFVLNIKTAENLQAQWKQIGVNVQINSVSTDELERNYIRPRNYQALLFAESTGADSDPFAFWHSSQVQNPGLNLALFKNQQADRLISDARNTFDQNLRAQKYLAFQKILYNEVPAIFLDQSLFVYETTPDLRGIQLQTLAKPEDRFYDVIHWYVETRRKF